MFFSHKNSILGVDIGTANIKVAQITHGDAVVLDTYGIVNASFPLGGNDGYVIEKMADTLKTLIDKAGVTTKRCTVSFPSTSVFTSVIELPSMSQSELSSAVEYEAKKYVPLALSEIDLAWEILTGDPKETGSMLKVLLTAVPKQINENYRKLLSQAKLDPIAGEIEALALIRSLVGLQAINCVIIDIGGKGTAINVIEAGVLKLSRNINVGGETITNKIAQALSITAQRAEQFKRDFGVSSSTFIPQTIEPVLSIVKTEVKQLLAIYQSHNVKVDKIILAGGGAQLPGLVAYFKDLGTDIELGDPFGALVYGQELEPVLKRYALSLPVAIGLALRTE
jgi:type IV pilus assembly protein PilM